MRERDRFRLVYPDKHRFSIPENIEGSVRSGSVKSPVEFACYFANPMGSCRCVQRKTGEAIGGVSENPEKHWSTPSSVGENSEP
jgi:hypothetical protein